jgi:hypothetical protein
MRLLPSMAMPELSTNSFGSWHILRRSTWILSPASKCLAGDWHDADSIENKRISVIRIEFFIENHCFVCKEHKILSGGRTMS